jgi:hypothetical protein
MVVNKLTVGLALTVLTMVGTASAVPITNLGSAVVSAGNGSIFVTGNGVTSGCLDWFNVAAPSGCQPSGTTATFSLQGGSTAPFVAGQAGTIADLNFNTPLPFVNFMQVPAAGGAHFDLISLRTNTNGSIGSCTGAGALLGGASCTPAGSPFQITNGVANASGVVDTVSVSLTVDLWGYTGTSGTNFDAANRYIGIFTTQGAVMGGTNIASILATISSGGAITASWSATLTPTTTPAIPEPGTYVLLGLGLISVASVRKRTRKA